MFGEFGGKSGERDFFKYLRHAEFDKPGSQVESTDKESDRGTRWIKDAVHIRFPGSHPSEPRKITTSRSFNLILVSGVL